MAASDSANNSSNTTVTCTQAIDQRIFKLGCLGPALAIIVLLACLKRRKHFKLEYCNGYPGLLTPVNFLRGRHNRFTVAATFGATASTCMELFFSGKNAIFIEGGPPWVKVFQAIITILVYGILFYPLFACMTTDHRLVGSLVGFLYVTIWFSFGVALDFQCLNSFGSISNELVTLQIIGGLPVYLCLIFIVIRFAVLLCLEVQRKWFHSSRELNKGTGGIAGEPEIVHVRKLFNPAPSLGLEDVKWYMRVIYFFYKPRTDFKFSTQFVSTLLVALIAVFQVSVAWIVILDLYKKVFRAWCSNDSCLEFWDVIFGRCKILEVDVYSQEKSKYNSSHHKKAQFNTCFSVLLSIQSGYLRSLPRLSSKEQRREVRRHKNSTFVKLWDWLSYSERKR